MRIDEVQLDTASRLNAVVRFERLDGVVPDSRSCRIAQALGDGCRTELCSQQVQKSPAPKLARTSGNSFDISMGLFRSGMWEFDTWKVSQPVRRLVTDRWEWQKSPPTADFCALARSLQTLVPPFSAAELPKISGRFCEYSRFRETVAGDFVRSRLPPGAGLRHGLLYWRGIRSWWSFRRWSRMRTWDSRFRETVAGDLVRSGEQIHRSHKARSDLGGRHCRRRARRQTVQPCRRSDRHGGQAGSRPGRLRAKRA